MKFHKIIWTWHGTNVGTDLSSASPIMNIDKIIRQRNPVGGRLIAAPPIDRPVARADNEF
ncbi:MAG TPA: hypothetical protein VFQ30_00140 [Ktedonobacteraceae bacterium]|nr:hypothetical protein [Ktedonobacteraceae bacterium]